MTNALATTNTLATTTITPSQNAALVYLGSLAEGSRRAMAGALNRIAALMVDGATLETLPWGMLRYQHTQAIRSQLAGHTGAASANQALSALRGTLKAAWRLGQMTADEYMAAADLQPVKAARPDQAAGRALQLGELMALVAVCGDGTKAGARDAAMLAVAYSCGLRRAEIVGLDLADYVDGVLVVRGKRNKTRTVPIQNGAAAALADWLKVRGDEPGALFWRIRSGDRLTGERMSTQAIYSIFAARAEAANVPIFSPHDLRRTFAGDLLDAGADISTVQKMMGHANVATTASYDRRGERAKKQAASKLHFPYRAK